MLRALAREPDTREALFAEFGRVKGLNALLDTKVARLAVQLADTVDLERRSRFLVERMALALQAATLLSNGNDLVADNFCQARLGSSNGMLFAAIPSDTPATKLIERAF